MTIFFYSDVMKYVALKSIYILPIASQGRYFNKYFTEPVQKVNSDVYMNNSFMESKLYILPV